MKQKSLQRVLFILLAALIIVFQKYFMLIYIVVFYASFEFLNQNENYIILRRRRVYNWLFLIFLAFVVFVRIHVFNFSEETEYHLNTLEHFFFAMIICLVINIYLLIFNVLRRSVGIKLVSVFVIFNLIGLFNEYFQNYFQEQYDFYLLKSNNIKDIAINVLGSLFFAVVSVNYKLRK